MTTGLLAMAVALVVAGDDRRLGRCVVGTGREAKDGPSVILRLPGVFSLVPATPVVVGKRRESGGVHTHASIVHSLTHVDMLIYSYVQCPVFYIVAQFPAANLVSSFGDIPGNFVIVNVQIGKINRRSSESENLPFSTCRSLPAPRQLRKF